MLAFKAQLMQLVVCLRNLLQLPLKLAYLLELALVGLDFAASLQMLASSFKGSSYSSYFQIADLSISIPFALHNSLSS